MHTEIENLRQIVKHKEEEKDEVKRRLVVELDAAKIRCNNEIETQNRLMQNKYEHLLDEITRLNSLVERMQKEKSDLLRRIEQEVLLNKQLKEQNEYLVNRDSNIENISWYFIIKAII